MAVLLMFHPSENSDFQSASHIKKILLNDGYWK